MIDDDYQKLENDVAEYLSTKWAWAFLEFMRITGLGTSRLFRWSEAFLSATPEELKGKKKLHKTTISKWIKRLGSEMSKQENPVEETPKNAPISLQYIIGHFPVQGEKIPHSNVSLIIVFEKHTQTLIHQVIDVTLNENPILFILAEAHERARDKVRNPSVICTVFLPNQTEFRNVWKCVAAQLMQPTEPNSATVGINWGTGKRWIKRSEWHVHEEYYSNHIPGLDTGDMDKEKLITFLKDVADMITQHFANQNQNMLESGKPSWVALGRTRKAKSHSTNMTRL